MNKRIDRREMLRISALAGVGIWIGSGPAGARAPSPNEKLDIALIGIGGRGRANLDALARENLIALCDVDEERAGNAWERFPEAKKYHDYRRMYDDLETKIDAVVVSTPDHTHFHPALRALRMGKHLYLEKPMAHCLWEVRTLTGLAAEKGVATQLGVQRHALDNVHRVVELVRVGSIGEVRECHAWIGGDRGMPPIPTDSPPVPPHLEWDLWLGPAAERPYSPAYVPYEWRFWWDFGTGETGNWGCHILDLPFWALELRSPTRVEASGPPVDPRRSSKSMAVRYEFPARGSLPPLALYWYHSKDGPPILRERGLPHLDTGILFVGSKGMLLCDFEKRTLYPEERFKDFIPPPRSVPDSPGFTREWTDACRGGARPTCHFGYSGPLSEVVLLGNLAYRIGKPFEWDAAALEAKGVSEAARRIREEYRKGWEA